MLFIGMRDLKTRPIARISNTPIAEEYFWALLATVLLVV